MPSTMSRFAVTASISPRPASPTPRDENPTTMGDRVFQCMRVERRGWRRRYVAVNVEDKASMPALQGIRLVGISHWAAGPYGLSLLGDMGADVINIEGIEGDGLRERDSLY